MSTARWEGQAQYDSVWWKIGLGRVFFLSFVVGRGRGGRRYHSKSELDCTSTVLYKYVTVSLLIFGWIGFLGRCGAACGVRRAVPVEREREKES